MNVQRMIIRMLFFRPALGQRQARRPGAPDSSGWLQKHLSGKQLHRGARKASAKGSAPAKKSGEARKTRSKSSTPPARPWLRRLWLAFLLVAGVGVGTFGILYLYFASKLDEEMGARVFDQASRLYAAPLRLDPGVRLPPGALEEHIAALGYVKAKPVQSPGEFRTAEGGTLYVSPRPAWPGLSGVPAGTLELKLEDRTLLGLKKFKGPALKDAVLPPVPFAELRGPDPETRKVVEFKMLPKVLLDAVVAIEDQRYYEHFGIDPKSLIRAAWVNLQRGGRSQGGSTLTQQLAKNRFLTHEKSFVRKIKEIFFALALERRYTKDQILTFYLNEIYLGQRGSVGISGMAQAAYAFFSREVSQLKLEEAALLAGIIQAPNAYAPEKHPEKALARRNVVLKKMLEQGKITQKEYDAAVKTSIKLRPGRYLGRTAPNFVDYVVEALGERFSDTQWDVEGYAIETTLDLRVQQAAEKALSSHLASLQKSAKVPLEGAVVVLEPASGRILAMVGGRDYGVSQFNRATKAKRQPGSAAKPFVMLTAFTVKGQELGPTSPLQDEPLTLSVEGKPYSPQNSDKQFHGIVTVRQTLEQSLNVPTVRLADDVGVEKLARTLTTLGIPGPLKARPSLALGAFEATPLELASAYTALANGGQQKPAFGISRVRDRDGKVLYEADEASGARVGGVESWLVRDLMRGVLDRGTGKEARKLGYTFAASGKTGTTNDARDTWFVGFDAELLVVVWVGSDENLPTDLTGGKAALPVWVQLMKSMRQSSRPPEDPLPDGLQKVEVCLNTLQLPTELCTEKVTEVFWESKVPTEACSLHGVSPLEALLPMMPPGPEFMQGMHPGRPGLGKPGQGHPGHEKPGQGKPGQNKPDAGGPRPFGGFFRNLFGVGRD